MTVAEIKALAKGSKLENVTGVFSKISAFRKTATGKVRQSAVLQDNTAEIQMVIWGGQIDNLLFGSVFSIKQAFVDEYKSKKRLTINSGDAVTLVKAKEGYVPKTEQSATPETKVTPPKTEAQPTSVSPVEHLAQKPVATTGAVSPKTTPVASTDRTEVKAIMQECIEDVTALMSGLGLTAENFTASVNTLFIERSKRIRKERF